MIQARIRWLLGDIPTALEMSSRAANAGIPSPDDAAFHAMLLQFSGRIDEAIQVLERCLQRWPWQDYAEQLQPLQPALQDLPGA